MLSGLFADHQNEEEMGKIFIAALAALSLSIAVQATTFHVATNGSDANRGTEAAPFRTIQHAANLAQPGDVISVHEGFYRERVSPPRGGTSDANRIASPPAGGRHGRIESPPPSP